MGNSQKYREDCYKLQKARYKQRSFEARLVFFVTLPLFVIGVLIFFLGFGLLLFKNPAGTSTAWIGGLSSFITGVIFLYSREANKRLDEVDRELQSLADKIDGIYKAEDAIGQISDQVKKDRAWENLAQESHRGSLESFKVPTDVMSQSRKDLDTQ